jgi:predicted transcriptional regulator of viral defense system
MKYEGGVMANTILNTNQQAFLEEIILRHGTVVTYQQIIEHIPYQDEAAKRRFVSHLTRAGWLVRIKKGLYQVAADLGSLGTLTLSNYVVAQLLHPGSYVSFESALQFHGLHDQLMRSTTSTALKQHATVTVQSFTYRFVKTTEQYFYGFEEHILAGHRAQIATVEKALIDMVQFHRSVYSADRVLEILSEDFHNIDEARLTTYLLRANITTQRLFGLFFDKLNLSYDEKLVENARNSPASSRVDGTGQAYSAKWRLYYDPGMFRNYQITQNT